MKPMEFLLAAVLFGVWDIGSPSLFWEFGSYLLFAAWALASLRQFSIQETEKLALDLGVTDDQEPDTK